MITIILTLSLFINALFIKLVLFDIDMRKEINIKLTRIFICYFFGHREWFYIKGNFESSMCERCWQTMKLKKGV